MSWLWPQRDGESSEVPDSLDPTLCGVDSMCQDIREAESEKVCVNVHERHCMLFVCLHILCMRHSISVYSRCRRSWGSHSHSGSRSAAKCDGRKWERGGEPEQLSNVFTYSEQKWKWSTGYKLAKSQQGQRTPCLGAKFHSHESGERLHITAAWNSWKRVNYSWYSALTWGVK